MPTVGRPLLAAAIALGLGIAGMGASLAQNMGRPPNERPMYGGFPKTPEMLAVDEKFLNDIRQIIQKDGRTMAQVSDHFVTRGWEAYVRRDFVIAMRRFNQAWLVDADNGDAYHGFALVVLERDKNVPEGERFFREALAKQRHSPGVYIDYGRFLLVEKRPAEAIPYLRKAVAVPDMTTSAYAFLAMALYETNDKAGACDAAAKVKSDALADLIQNTRQIQSHYRCPPP